MDKLKLKSYAIPSVIIMLCRPLVSSLVPNPTAYLHSCSAAFAPEADAKALRLRKRTQGAV
eukprot:5896908-Lingulodinium_polyedra.AAC.1